MFLESTVAKQMCSKRSNERIVVGLAMTGHSKKGLCCANHIKQTCILLNTQYNLTITSIHVFFLSISPGCKPYITEAGPKVLDSLYDKRIWEACYLINAPLPTFQYLQMNDLIRDGLMVLIGIQSQTFHLDKVSIVFHFQDIFKVVHMI